MAISSNETYLDNMSLRNESQYNGTLKENNVLLNMYNNEMLVTQLPAIIYTSIMMILGLPGNIIVFYIYFFNWRRSTSRMFILFLAALDTMNCSTTLPMEIYIMINSLKLDQPLLCKVSRYCTYVMNCSSALILVGIAADRFKRICRPYQRAFSEKQSKYISICAILFSMAITWPSLILYGTRKVSFGNVTVSVCLIENKYDGTPYPMVYFSCLTTTTLITFTILIVLYYFIGLQIYRHRKFKLKHCSHVQKIVEEKSCIAKSAGEELKSSNRGAENDINPDKDDEKREIKGETIVKTENIGELTQYLSVLPTPSPDAETSCGLLDVSYLYDGKPCANLLEKNIDVNTDDANVHSLIGVRTDRVPSPKKASRQRSFNQGQIPTKNVRARYLLVRGASSVEASRSNKCANCLTLRIGRSTLMLFLITLAYVISFLPFYSLVIVRQSDTTFVRELSKSGLAAYHLFLRSYLLSSVVNPFIYSFCNAQFRDYCKETFSKILLRR